MTSCPQPQHQQQQWYFFIVYSHFWAHTHATRSGASRLASPCSSRVESTWIVLSVRELSVREALCTIRVAPSVYCVRLMPHVLTSGRVGSDWIGSGRTRHIQNMSGTRERLSAVISDQLSAALRVRPGPGPRWVASQPSNARIARTRPMHEYLCRACPVALSLKHS